MAAEALLHAAVLNNARWCDAVCRSHGYPGEFTGRLWTSVGHALPFYPNAITLSPDVTAAEATASQDRSRPFAVKDSFARLDLAPPAEAGHWHHAAAAGQEDHVVGQAGAQVRVPFGDRDLLAQHGVLLGGHGRHHPLLVGALDPAADRPADELRGRVHNQPRHGVLD
jgi:hypothetical protein